MNRISTTISIIATLFSINAFAAEPVPANNGKCPIFYSKHKGYCQPRIHADDAIVRQGNSCPIGWVKSGGYCTKSSNLVRPTIERTGSSCPYGYSKSERYCVKR